MKGKDRPTVGIVVPVRQFRFIRKDGNGSASRWLFRQIGWVRITKAWNRGFGVTLYQGEAADPFLEKFMKKKASPTEPSIYFGEGDIA